MPQPKPKADESKEDWIDRCMSDDVMKDEYSDNDHRLAVCNTIWEDKDEESKSLATPQIERRVLTVDDAELRVSDGKDGKPVHMIGYAARFNKDSENLGFVGMAFVERIKPGAFDEALQNSDVRGLKNHDPNLLLGRVGAGTMELWANSRGLKYDITAPDTTTGRDTVEEIRRRDISGSSFSFTIAPGGEEWEEKDGRTVRTITKVDRLFDVGPVAFPAYPDTSVAVRSLETFHAVKEGIEQARRGELGDGPDLEAGRALANAIEEPAEPEARGDGEYLVRPEFAQLLLEHLEQLPATEKRQALMAELRSIVGPEPNGTPAPVAEPELEPESKGIGAEAAKQALSEAEEQEKAYRLRAANREIDEQVARRRNQ